MDRLQYITRPLLCAASLWLVPSFTEAQTAPQPAWSVSPKVPVGSQFWEEQPAASPQLPYYTPSQEPLSLQPSSTGEPLDGPPELPGVVQGGEVLHDHAILGGAGCESDCLANPFAERFEAPCELFHEDERLPLSHWWEVVPEALTWPNEPVAELLGAIFGMEHVHVETELHEHAIGLQPVPARPPLILEWNDKFLSNGELSQGYEMPSGVIWRPSVWVFGQYRTAIQHFDNRGAAQPVTEWAHQLDLFGQLNLSGTERLFLSIRPFDEEEVGRREFSSYDFNSGNSLDGNNANIQTLFFEGDFGEIFPRLDPYDHKWLDYGFSVGRQPMLLQQGLLINEDAIDAVTVTRNTINGLGILNGRVTGFYAWNQVHRNNNTLDQTANLYGISTETDFAWSTVEADVVWAESDNPAFGGLVAFGISAIQRIKGHHNTYNTSLHVLGSYPTNAPTAASNQGTLLFAQTSWTPHKTEDLIYLNTFWAIDQFTSPARGTLMGGPLGQTGITFAAPGVGRFGAPMSNAASDVAGASLGYQMFFDETRRQVINELGGRYDTTVNHNSIISYTSRYQQAIGQHWIFVVDGFVAKQESIPLRQGARVEFLLKF